MKLGHKLEQITKRGEVNKQHLHSEYHLFADEYSKKFGEPRRFAFYLKTAMNVGLPVARSLAGKVLEGRDVKTPGKLFAYLVKKYNEEKNKK